MHPSTLSSRKLDHGTMQTLFACSTNTHYFTVLQKANIKLYVNAFPAGLVLASIYCCCCCFYSTSSAKYFPPTQLSSRVGNQLPVARPDKPKKMKQLSKNWIRSKKRERALPTPGIVCLLLAVALRNWQQQQQLLLPGLPQCTSTYVRVYGKQCFKKKFGMKDDQPCAIPRYVPC